MAAKQTTPQQAAMFHQSQGYVGCFDGCCFHEAIERAENAEERVLMLLEDLQAAHDRFDRFRDESVQSLAQAQGRLLAYTQREDGKELCEAHPGHWHPIEEMMLTEDGAWLCREAWDELVGELS